jgi:hypothetical protein
MRARREPFAPGGLWFGRTAKSLAGVSTFGFFISVHTYDPAARQIVAGIFGERLTDGARGVAPVSRNGRTQLDSGFQPQDDRYSRSAF